MVVVYSGDSDRPPPRWEAPAQSERRTQIDFDLPRAPDSALGEPHTPSDGLDDKAPRRVGQHESGWPTASDIDESASAMRGVTAPSNRRFALWPLALVAAVAVALGALALRGESPAESVGQIAGSASTAHPAAAALMPSPMPAVANAAPLDARAAQAPAVAAPAASSLAPDAEVPRAQRVTIEVFPDDAKVLRRGQPVGGPPYSVEIPPGKRVAVEVTSPGYVTRRVVLDGSEPMVMIGLFQKNGAARDVSRPPRQARPATVRSGL